MPFTYQAPALPEAGDADAAAIKSVLAVMRVPKVKPARRSLSSGSLGSVGLPAPLADVEGVSLSADSLSAEVRSSCSLQVEALEDSLQELRSLQIGIEAQT